MAPTTNTAQKRKAGAAGGKATARKRTTGGTGRGNNSNNATMSVGNQTGRFATLTGPQSRSLTSNLGKALTHLQQAANLMGLQQQGYASGGQGKSASSTT